MARSDEHLAEAREESSKTAAELAAARQENTSLIQELASTSQEVSSLHKTIEHQEMLATDSASSKPSQCPFIWHIS